MEEGRGMVIAANKWDLVTDRRKAREEVAERLEWSLSQVAGVPVVECSGLTGRGMEKLLPAAAKVYDVWNQRVSTGDLNRWLQAMTDAHPPPMAKGRQVKLRYMTQAKSRPPTFIVFSSQPKELVESYQRYLINGLRDAFGFAGVPIRIHMRKGGDNPYAKG
jgi:GTP-binding protein